ncbi:MAG: hypothetical protein QOK06_2609, partial [Acidimicrobiaceae bacterium]
SKSVPYDEENSGYHLEDDRGKKDDAPTYPVAEMARQEEAH